MLRMWCSSKYTFADVHGSSSSSSSLPTFGHACRPLLLILQKDVTERIMLESTMAMLTQAQVGGCGSMAVHGHAHAGAGGEW